MVSISEAKGNVLNAPYRSSESIKELALFKHVLSVYETHSSAVSLRQDAIRPLSSILVSMNSSFRSEIATLKEDLDRLQNDIRQGNTLASKKKTELTSRSPFQRFVQQLNSDNQLRFYMVLVVCKVYIYSILLFYVNYNTTSDYTQFSFHLERLVSQNRWLKDLPGSFLETFVLEKGSPQGQFRQELQGALSDPKLRLYCLGSSHALKPIGNLLTTILFHQLNLETKLSSSGERILLYMRYIAQFIRAPYMNSYKKYTQSPIASIVDAIKIDIEVLIPPKFINDVRQTREYRSGGFGF